MCFGLALGFAPPVGVFGVGHPEQPLPDVRRPDAVCAQNRKPDGVAEGRQVSLYSIDPPRRVSESACARQSFRELVRLSEIAVLNRDNESSLKLSTDNFCGRDLLTENDRGASSLDESLPGGPKMSSVICTAALAGLAERLAGAASRPDGPVVGPAGELNRERPATDAREEVAVDEAGEVGGADVSDVPPIDPRRASSHSQSPQNASLSLR